MNELIKLIAKKTGLSEAMALVAVNLTLDFLKKKLPKAVGSQIDLLLANEDKIATAVAAADLVGGLVGSAKKASAKKAGSKK